MSADVGCRLFRTDGRQERKKVRKKVTKKGRKVLWKYNSRFGRARAMAVCVFWTAWAIRYPIMAANHFLDLQLNQLLYLVLAFFFSF